MATAFWTNTIWFIILGIITIIEIGFILFKAKDLKHVIALFFIVSGITFGLEATICCFLKAYKYYPMLIPQSPIDDGLAGNLFSQFSITATALLIAVYNLKYHWFLIFAGLYGIIEELFIRLGIYTHNWYQTWMTVVGFTLFFWIAKKMYSSNIIYLNHKTKYFFMIFGLYTLHMPIILWIQILSGIVAPNTKILSDPMSSYAFVCLLNLFFLIAACMFIYFSNTKWFFKSIATLILYAVIYLAYKANLILISKSLFLIFATIDIWGMYLCIYILDKLMTGRHWSKGI